MDAYGGKRNDVIDTGGEYDYAGQQWFADVERPPPRATPAPPPPPAAPYQPSPDIVESNQAMTYALESAPNVLYGRYKAYGQLGALGWCSEFSELIDHLKDLGTHGNMFVTTRTQALRTCEDVLKLGLDIKMQLIVMYISYQVSRLRRFLDTDRVWNDYPEVQFPVNPPGP